jgi:hypothetical protein
VKTQAAFDKASDELGSPVFPIRHKGYGSRPTEVLTWHAINVVNPTPERSLLSRCEAVKMALDESQFPKRFNWSIRPRLCPECQALWVDADEESTFESAVHGLYFEAQRIKG